LRRARRPCSGSHLGIGSGPLRAADGAEQHGIGAPTQRKRGRRHGLAGGIDGGAAEQRVLEFQGVAEFFCHRSERAHAFGCDLAADTITGQHRNGRPHHRRAAS